MKFTFCPKIMKINNKEDVWSDKIIDLWKKYVEIKFKDNQTCSSANYFTPRPYRNEWNRGSNTSGFIYTVQPGNNVCYVYLNSNAN